MLHLGLFKTCRVRFLVSETSKICSVYQCPVRTRKNPRGRFRASSSSLLGIYSHHIIIGIAYQMEVMHNNPCANTHSSKWKRKQYTSNNQIDGISLKDER